MKKNKVSLGSQGPGKRYSWRGWLPADVMEDLRRSQIIHEALVEAMTEMEPDLPEKTRRMLGLLRKDMESNIRSKIQCGRRWVNERWPGWWTPEVELFFKNWD